MADPEALSELCRSLAGADYVTIDTEFMREKTYWPKLCLVQIAGPERSAAIDPLAEGMTLEPLFGLLKDPTMLKVFHAARQDIEIFVHLMGDVPAPIFDTQVAAMVCGFGDAVAYEGLAAKLTGTRIDKAMRFTDWSRRPLTEKQILYALDDVIHLRPIYRKLAHRLEKNGRAGWLDEEMAILTDPATYRLEPDEAWRRIKMRGQDPKRLALLRELASWREREAQRLDIPRRRVLRDEALLEIAASAPRSEAELERIRGLGHGALRKSLIAGLLEAIARGLTRPPVTSPKPKRTDNKVGPVIELLKVLLKAKCESAGVAQRLVATAADIERLAAGEDDDIPVLRGWRFELFGKDALALKSGRLALAIENGKVARIERTGGAPSRSSGQEPSGPSSNGRSRD
jgi:ribonuclease D